VLVPFLATTHTHTHTHTQSAVIIINHDKARYACFSHIRQMALAVTGGFLASESDFGLI